MKVIFLDFDGVITTHKSQYRLDEEKMKLVKYICEKQTHILLFLLRG